MCSVYIAFIECMSCVCVGAALFALSIFFFPCTEKMKSCYTHQDSHVVYYSKQQISYILPSNTIAAVISIHYGTRKT